MYCLRHFEPATGEPQGFEGWTIQPLVGLRASVTHLTRFVQPETIPLPDCENVHMHYLDSLVSSCESDADG